MISINQQKLVRALQQKKKREEHKLFLVEGEKIIRDLLNAQDLNIKNLVLLFGDRDCLKNMPALPKELENLFIEVGLKEMKKLSSLLTPPPIMAVVRMPQSTFTSDQLKQDLTLVFDAIRDPGNLGTIIRTAAWFGIKTIICSPDSVDQFNSKVVQASMGSIFRLSVFYRELSEVFQEAARFKIPVYGTTMDGNDFLDTPVKIPSLIVFGNESTGIHNEYYAFFRDKLRIPEFPGGQSHIESLNIASSVAIVCSELRRRGR